MILGAPAKNDKASRTVMSSTPSIPTPRYRTSSTCGLNRRPPHSSHGTNTSARNCISTRTTPSPSHPSQRPPGTLKEKWPGVSPAARAPPVCENSSRIGSNAFR